METIIKMSLSILTGVILGMVYFFITKNGDIAIAVGMLSGLLSVVYIDDSGTVNFYNHRN